jgi:hypothetical protein
MRGGLDMHKSKEEVLDLLVALGATRQEVADKLLSLGIRGNRDACVSCPIAQYLIANGVALGYGGVGYGLGRIGISVSLDVVHLYPIRKYPQLLGIRGFILAFDYGEYPKLEQVK